MSNKNGSTTQKTEALTKREKEILEILAKGWSHKQVACHLHISPDTARKHLKNIYKKLEVHNKVEALNKVKLL